MINRIWLILLTLAVVGLCVLTLRPVPHDVRATDVTSDEIDGRCYRLRWIEATDRRPGAVVTTTGVDCPYGEGFRR